MVLPDISGLARSVKVFCFVSEVHFIDVLVVLFPVL